MDIHVLLLHNVLKDPQLPKAVLLVHSMRNTGLKLVGNVLQVLCVQVIQHIPVHALYVITVLKDQAWVFFVLMALTDMQ